jgi:hypothetical protein
MTTTIPDVPPQLVPVQTSGRTIRHSRTGCCSAKSAVSTALTMTVYAFSPPPSDRLRWLVH